MLGMRPLVDDRQTDETGKHALVLRRGPIKQMIEQRIAYERARIGAQRSGNLMLGEIPQYRTQGQTGPIRGRPFRIDRPTRRNHVVRVGLRRIHEIRGAALQHDAPRGTLEPGCDDDVGIGRLYGLQQGGPGLGEADGQGHIGHPHLDVVRDAVRFRFATRGIRPPLGKRLRHPQGRIHVDAVIWRESGNDDIDLLHGSQCTWSMCIHRVPTCQTSRRHGPKTSWNVPGRLTGVVENPLHETKTEIQNKKRESWADSGFPYAAATGDRVFTGGASARTPRRTQHACAPWPPPWHVPDRGRARCLPPPAYRRAW